ncbi:MAG: DEAD/DEAH box helicase, partial [Gemmatimonadaceae bacterium]|nr:DEAD/DEAH box helicase [Gemmatimonadaceae bacterium]
MSDERISVRGEELVLLPERAAYWPARTTLLVADAHFGKAATFRAAAIPVPAGTTDATLGRLD